MYVCVRENRKKKMKNYKGKSEKNRRYNIQKLTKTTTHTHIDVHTLVKEQTNRSTIC